jgi:hypothetical protein
MAQKWRFSSHLLQVQRPARGTLAGYHGERVSADDEHDHGEGQKTAAFWIIY